MDRRWMDAEGGRAVHRPRRGRRLAGVVAVQNVLVIVCLAVTLYLCWMVQSQTSRTEQMFKENIHIQFNQIIDITGNVTLQLGEPVSKHIMSLADEKKEKIKVDCNGPYVLHMYVCYVNAENGVGSGTLQLQVDGRNEPVISFSLQTSQLVCRGLYNTTYLSSNEKASLHLNSTADFKIKNVTVGLSYMLGSRCDY